MPLRVAIAQMKISRSHIEVENKQLSVEKRGQNDRVAIRPHALDSTAGIGRATPHASPR